MKVFLLVLVLVAATAATPLRDGDLDRVRDYMKTKYDQLRVVVGSYEQSLKNIYHKASSLDIVKDNGASVAADIKKTQDFYSSLLKKISSDVDATLLRHRGKHDKRNSFFDGIADTFHQLTNGLATTFSNISSGVLASVSGTASSVHNLLSQATSTLQSGLGGLVSTLTGGLTNPSTGTSGTATATTGRK